MPSDNCDGESVPGPGLSAEQMHVWLHRYKRNAKVYAWGFYVALLPFVFGIIRTSMGELNADIFWSLGFFALGTFLLAEQSRESNGGALRRWPPLLPWNLTAFALRLF